MESVLEAIRLAARDWRPERMRPVADLKFTYEQEASPEDFFTPHLWRAVYDDAAIGWLGSRIVLFAPHDDGAAAAADESSLPALAEVDVDDGAQLGGPGHEDAVARQLGRDTRYS